MKRVMKKQLKGDEFVSTINKLVRFLKKKTREIIIFGGLVILFILLFMGFKLIESKNLKRESQTVGQLLSIQAGLDKNPSDLSKLESMAGRGKFSRTGYILLANYWIEKGDLEKARNFLDKIKEKPKDIFYYQAQDLKGQIYFQLKDYDKAIEIYKRIEQEKPKDYSLDVVLFQMAEAYEKKGDKSAALAIYKRIQDEFSQSYYGYDASLKIKKLG